MGFDSLKVEGRRVLFQPGMVKSPLTKNLRREQDHPPNSSALMKTLAQRRIRWSGAAR